MHLHFGNVNTSIISGSNDKIPFLNRNMAARSNTNSIMYNILYKE